MKSIVSGKPLEDITKLYNEHFNEDLPKSRIKTAMSNYHLKSGYKYDGHKAILFSPEEIEWLTENRRGFNFDVTTEKMNKRFGTNYKVSQVRGWCHAHHLPNGMDMKFPKGHVSFNKGRKGWCAPGCEKGWFKKGHRPYNSFGVDTEVINDDGYIKVKIAEPDVWELKHRLVWQKKYGKIPEGSCLIFLNGNRKDCRIENLMLIKRSILAVLNKEKLIFDDEAATKCGVTIAMIKSRISELKKRKS